MESFSDLLGPVLKTSGIALVIYGLWEFVYLAFISKKAPFRKHFLQPWKSIIALLGADAALKSLGMVLSLVALATAGNALAPFTLPNTWYGWILALLIYEFWYWVMHWMGHKVRLFWCVHAPHHAPPTINMSVGGTHHLLEALVYFPFFLAFMPALTGVPLAMLLVIRTIDGLWGTALHVSPDMVKRRYGILEYFMQTPSYHRAHHAKNVRYMDTNYNSITLFWDWVMGTLQPLRDDEPVDYGITREVNTESYLDVHFSEFRELWRDVRDAPGLWNKLAYIVMPPGWSHTGDHHTVALQKRQLFEAEALPRATPL